LEDYLMDIRKVSKAVAGAVAAGATAPGVMAVSIPHGVEAPWWGYVLAGVVSAVISYAGVWLAPANRPTA
tara:strand:- start:10325 stop:10534 length:210 start_codon:yes stop_codon:yes gene_type:complete